MYDIFDLLQNSEKYNENMVGLVASVGTKHHKGYVKIERKLTKREGKIRRRLGPPWSLAMDDAKPKKEEYARLSDPLHQVKRSLKKDGFLSGMFLTTLCFFGYVIFKVIV